MVNVRYDWPRIERVLRFLVPQGFSSAECAEITGVRRQMLTRRAKSIGFAFGEFFGPESKCSVGHKLMEVGYTDRSDGRRCHACLLGRKDNSAQERREQRQRESDVKREERNAERRRQRKLKEEREAEAKRLHRNAQRRKQRRLKREQEEAIARRKAAEERRAAREANPTGAASQSAAASNTILELVDAKERAATPWDREAIQQQINELQKRVTA